MKNLPLTQKQVIAVIELLKRWDCINSLTEHENQYLLIELKNIAGTALMEANNQMQNILPSLYKSINELPC